MGKVKLAGKLCDLRTIKCSHSMCLLREQM